MSFYVYLIFRKNGLPCYVGKGSGGRWAKHVANAKNPHLRNIYREAGGDLPVVKLRENLTEQEAFELERALILAIGREKTGGSLVNFTDGGDGPAGYEHTGETRKIMAAKALERWTTEDYATKVVQAQNVGRSTPEYRSKRKALSKKTFEAPEARERMREAKVEFFKDPLNRQVTSAATKAAMSDPEVRARVSAAQKERFSRPEEIERLRQANLGRKQSQEEKDKRAESLRGGKRTPEQRAKMSAWQVGRKMSDEAKEKMRAAAKRRFENPGERAKLAEAGRKGASKRWGLYRDDVGEIDEERYGLETTQRRDRG